jgi:hypothetical protein
MFSPFDVRPKRPNENSITDTRDSGISLTLMTHVRIATRHSRHVHPTKLARPPHVALRQLGWGARVRDWSNRCISFIDVICEYVSSAAILGRTPTKCTTTRWSRTTDKTQLDVPAGREMHDVLLRLETRRSTTTLLDEG